MSTRSCSISFRALSSPTLGSLASSSVTIWMSRPPALLPTSAMYILKPLSIGLPAGAVGPDKELIQPIFRGPPAAALPAGLALAAALAAAPEAAGLADALAAVLPAGLALAAAEAGALAFAAALAGAGALDAGAAPPPQPASTRQSSPPKTTFAFM